MTPQKIESDLKWMCEEAKALGAADAVSFKASDIMADPRVTLKCRVPICAYYGNNLMCPPFTLKAYEFQLVLPKYTYAVLIQVEILLTKDLVQAVTQADSFAQLFKENKNLFVQSVFPSWKKFHELISKIEASAFKLGYRFAAGFGGGACMLCDECVAKQEKEPCRHPFQARPSMEAVGIDVFKTVEKAGITPLAPAMDKIIAYGLVLID